MIGGTRAHGGVITMGLDVGRKGDHVVGDQPAAVRS